ncbi:MAG: NTP transferase domain-containing protein [Flavobacteriales bacterium]
MKRGVSLIVLAAGRGSRFGGLKQFIPVGPHGEKLLEYTLYDALRAGFSQVVFIIRKRISQESHGVFQDLAKRIPIALVHQEIDVLPAGSWRIAGREKPWGTGHALWVAREVVQEPFGVVNADDFYGREAITTLAEYLQNPGTAPGALVTYPVEKTLSRFGAVSRGTCHVQNGYLAGIAEREKVEAVNGEISYQGSSGRIEIPKGTPVSMNLWGGTPVILDRAEACFKAFLKENAQRKNAEFYLSTIYNRAIGEAGIKIKALHADSEWFGLTYAEDIDCVKQRIADLIQAGIYPAHLWT